MDNINLTDEQIDELARQKKNEYQREWHNREENKGKRMEYQKRHYRNLVIKDLKEQKKA